MIGRKKLRRKMEKEIEKGRMWISGKRKMSTIGNR